ncbi:pyruvate kinase [Winogradskyella sp.]|jgi:pyruvate kinase|uniref:pyruvate kinase n=1 Tax=Winogradskyella sp. TaxID=1883156 RepID=UPI0025FAE000|nr:pyruvate kinase [Winogradskyella sp.]MCT4629895.1 pyruvate kinase [Winogradskyella sp.]
MTTSSTKKIDSIITQLTSILEVMESEEKLFENTINTIHPDYQKSARNLVQYQTFRKHDLRRTQKKLRNLGITRFSNAEAHTKASILKALKLLHSLKQDDSYTSKKAGLSIKNGKRLLNKHSKELLGFRSKGRRVRIMVTLPIQAAYDYNMVHNMVKSGMNCVRINCAHDDVFVWERIIKNVKKASKKLGKKIKIAMDLAGPKIRTGAIITGPQVRKFSPKRDDIGNIILPARIILVDILKEDSEKNCLPISKSGMANLNIGDIYHFTDTRNKKRRLKIVELTNNYAVAHCYETSYIATNMVLTASNHEAQPLIIGEIPDVEQAIILKENDVLTITKAPHLGAPAQLDEDGNILKSARISCQLPKVFDYIKSGESILFDDGKIEGEISTVNNDSFEVLITRAKPQGSKLKAEKGMNFPDSELGIHGLTQKDKTDLEFVAKHADIVNFSFVNSPNDVDELLTELKRLNVINKLNIILKIETRAAFYNLPAILLSAMKVKHIGVMIARGDLAIETGWNNIGKIQEEIISICAAAHIPVVWATQVLENLAKKGLPSRSEITDAANSIRAESVMLNKGPYILEVLQLLNVILSDMESLHEKNENMLPKLDRS